MIVAVIDSFSATDVASVGGLDTLLENPAVRALYGMPFDVTNAGGFTVWRVGTFLCVFAGLWALMATTRVLRGEEEAGRWDLLLTSPVTRARRAGQSREGARRRRRRRRTRGVRIVRRQAANQPDRRRSTPSASTLLTLTFVAVGAVTSQLFGARRRAVGTAGGVLGVSYVIRMIADGTTGRRSGCAGRARSAGSRTSRRSPSNEPAAAGAARPSHR